MSVKARCDHCGKKTDLRDERAGFFYRDNVLMAVYWCAEHWPDYGATKTPIEHDEWAVPALRKLR